MEKLDPPSLPPKSKMGMRSVFALRTASSLILGGWELVVPFQFCPGQSKWKIQNSPPPTPPPPKKKSKMGKWRVFALREALSLIGVGGGDGCLLIHFILSEILVPHTCLQDYLKQFAGKGEPTYRVNSFAFFALFLSFVLPLHLNFLCWALIRLYSIL